jgi:glycerophosphoryl diester phosphodiesterase
LFSQTRSVHSSGKEPTTMALDTEFFDSPRPRIIAHRGFSAAYPENTMPAFRAASEAGALYLELDIHMTNDGEIVVLHDDDLRRIAAHEGIVAEMSLAEISAADAGYNFPAGIEAFPFRGKGIRVPTLGEVLAAFPRQLFIIEIKQTFPSLVEAALGTIKRAGMSRRVLIASEHQEPLDEVRALAPSIPTNFSSREVGAFMQSLPPGAPAFSPPGAALQVPPEYLSWKLVTPLSVAVAHRIGVEVHVWTVNEAAEARTLLAVGVDGIITDDPPTMLEIARST